MPRRLKVLNVTLKVLSLTLPILLLQDFVATPAAAQGKPCSFTRTNHDCEITLSRNSFVFPAPLQMYPGSVVTVGIQGGNDFERYTLDPAPGQATALTDVTSTALGNLTGIFASAGSIAAATASPVPPAPAVAPPPPPPPDAALGRIQVQNQYLYQGNDSGKRIKATDPCEKDPNGAVCRQIKAAELADAVAKALATQRQKEKDDQDQKAKDDAIKAETAFNAYVAICDADHVSQFSSESCKLDLLKAASQRIVDAANRSQDFYAKLNTLLTPDSQPPLAQLPIPDTSRQHIPFQDLLRELCGQSASGPPNYLPCGLEDDHGLVHRQADATANAAALLARMTKPPSNVTVPSTKLYPQPSPTVVNTMQLLTGEQAALDAIRKDLEGYASRLQDLVTHATTTVGTVGYIQDSHIDRHVTRSINYTLNRLNLVSNSQAAANDGSKKVPIVTIVVVYGEARWEASTGIALVFRPIRTFTVAPNLSNGTQYISESKAAPELAPFVAADYRLGSDFNFFGWRGAAYATTGIGYNTSQQSADFLVGPSISWRGFLLSGLCDFGHGSRLAQSLTVGEQLGTATAPTTITTLPTSNYWVPAFTVGISVRIPGISGR